MRKTNLKIGGIIIIFSVILSTVFVIVCLWFRWTTHRAFQIAYSSIEGVIINSTSADYMIADMDAKPGQNIVSPDVFSSFYSTQIFGHLKFIIVILCVIIMLSSFILWRILLILQRKSDIQLVQNLQAITDGNEFASIDPAFSAVYQQIRQKSLDRITDYKRLHSYLSHEQQNNIAILRAELELSGNTEQIKTIDKISNSIDDILTLSESVEDTQKMVVDVCLICAEVCDTYKNISDLISFSFDEEDHSILAKERWIYRAASNLVDNAVKYGNGKPIEVSVNRKNHSIILLVKDYGIGIDRQAQEEIFDHRFRINELHKDGYGIGLSLVSHVCNLCGGFVLVESEANKGSAFYLSFPGIDAGINIQ